VPGCDHHARRLGEFLLPGRLIAIVEQTDTHGVRLGTSRLSRGFFERYRFGIRSTEQGGIDAGLGKVEIYPDLPLRRRRRLPGRWRARVAEAEEADDRGRQRA
jgi:hypothetical protein